MVIERAAVLDGPHANGGIGDRKLSMLDRGDRRQLECVNEGKTDKITRYGWKVRNSPGRLEWLPKDVLRVDHSYQRAEKQAKILAIAQDWDWRACGVLDVALRDFVHWVFDGQQRACAAALRSDIVELPCYIHETEDVTEEAQAFLNRNTGCKPVSAIEKFDALLLAGDRTAIEVCSLVDRFGYRISEGQKTGKFVKCVSCLLLLQRKHPEVLTNIWPLLVELVRGEFIHERIVESLVFVETWLMKNRPRHSILRKPWRDRVLRLGSQGLLDAAAEGARFFSSGGARAWGMGIGQELDKGNRHKLRIGFPEQE